MSSSVGMRYETNKTVATNANLDIRVTCFKPRRLTIRNKTNGAMMEYNESLPVGSWWKTVAAGTRTFVTSGGPLLLDGDSSNPPGFRIPATADINDTTTEELYWEAEG